VTAATAVGPGRCRGWLKRAHLAARLTAIGNAMAHEEIGLGPSFTAVLL